MSFTNKEVDEWFNNVGSLGSGENYWQEFIKDFSLEDPNLCVPLTFWNKVSRLQTKLSTLKRNSTKRQQLLDAEFLLPQKNSFASFNEENIPNNGRRETKLQSQNETLKEERHRLKIENNSLKRKADSSLQLQIEYESQLGSITDLRKSLKEALRGNKIAEGELNKCREKFNMQKKVIDNLATKLNTVKQGNTN